MRANVVRKRVSDGTVDTPVTGPLTSQQLYMPLLSQALDPKPDIPKQPEPEELISLSSLAHKLEVNYIRMICTFHAAHIQPDVTNGVIQYFRLQRIPELKKLFLKK